MSWNLAALRDHIRNQSDSMHQLALVASIDRYILIYQYHLYTARDSMEGIIHREGESDEFHNLRYVFGDAENQEEYNEAKLINEAHLLAAIHSIRAMYDIFGQLVNCLVLENRFSIEKCTIFRVSETLPRSALKSCLEDLIALHWFRWLSDFVNTIKHRRLMAHTFKVYFDRPGSELVIDGFEYHDRSHPSYTDREILKGTIVVKNKIIDCGKALNALVIDMP